MSTRYIPLANGHANANTQHSNRHLKPKINLPRWHRLPLEGERFGGATNVYTHSSSRRSMPQKLVHTPNEPNTLITISIKSETPCSSEIPQVRLAHMHWHADDTNGPGCRVDASKGQTDVSRAWTDTLNMLNRTATPGMSHGDDPSTYLDARDAKRNIDKTDGLGSHVDALGGYSDMPSVKTDALIPTIALAIIRTTRKRGKPPNLPAQSAKWLPDEPNGRGNCTDTSSARRDTYNVAYNADTAGNAQQNVNMRPIESKLPKSLTMGENSCTNKTDGSSHHPGMLNMHMHMITPADEVGNIRMRQIKPKMPNSPAGSATSHSDKPNVEYKLLLWFIY